MNSVEEQKTRKTVVDRLWNFLASVKLAIIIFAFIALTSIVGTVLEQRADPAKNILILSKLFGESSAPALYAFFDSLGFIDMYRSWWFKAVLVLFSVNIVICSFDRLPRIWKLVKEPLQPMPEDKLGKLPINRQIIIKGKPDAVRATVTEALKTTRFRFAEVEEERGYQFYAQKGNYGRLGVYITHFSILFILIGAMLGMQFGFKGYLNLPEGALSNVAVSNTDREIPLGFDVRCDSFDVDFYSGSDMPKEYKSWLTIFKDGRQVMRKSIVVNDPLTYEGITFYQSSYGMVPGAAQKGIAVLNAVSRTGKTAALYLKIGDTFQIPDSAVTGKILDFSPALQLDEHGHAVTYANMMNNPALLVEFTEGEMRLFSGWLLRRHPETWQLPNGDRVEFIDYWGVEYTGLQVRKDPGVWVVYLGCITMSIGLFIAFFMSHRRIWVKLSDENNATRVLIGATTNKNKAAFERTIDRIVSILSKKQEGVK